jgi:hypothetical protein
MPKSIAGWNNPLARAVVGSRIATRACFEPAGEKQPWLLKTP